MITVVTITFNNYEELVSTLKSIESSITPNVVESLVINGGNCSATEEFLNHSQIPHINEKDFGISDAFNKGILAAKGDYIAFLNSGDLLINNDYYHKANSYLESNPEVDYIYGVGSFKHNLYGTYEVLPQMQDITLGMPFMHCTMIVKKSELLKIGCFNLNKKIAMDFDVLIRLHKAQAKSHFLNLSTSFLMDGNGISSNRGLEGVNECIETLKINELYHLKEFVFYNVLKIKHRIRQLFTFLGINDSYNRYKQSKIKSLNKS